MAQPHCQGAEAGPIRASRNSLPFFSNDQDISTDCRFRGMVTKKKTGTGTEKQLKEAKKQTEEAQKQKW